MGNYKQYCYRLFVCLAGVMVTLGGCAPPAQRPGLVCPGKDSLADSLETLKHRSEMAAPLKATGQCRARFSADGKDYNENFPVKIWINPPSQVRLHGDIFFKASGIDLGSNKDEFWLAIKPKEISTYSWGKWSEQDSSQRILIDPKTLLEALGVTEISEEDDWYLINKDGFDVLTNIRNRRIARKLYINTCDYTLSKIKYFGDGGRVWATTELRKYKRVTDNCSVPTVIEIRTRSESDSEDVFKITLSSIQPKTFTEEKQEVFFGPPSSKGFKHIYRMIDGDMIEQ